MLKLADIFNDGMIIQRGKPFNIFGFSDEDTQAEVKLNGENLGVHKINKGDFLITLPPQKETENATLTVGGITLKNVDFGEIWIAGGQSNMHFYLKWDKEREEVYALPPDEHLRYYEVAKIAFEGEENDGFLDMSRFNKWNRFDKQSCGYFSAAAAYFALKLRKELGVPVGIVGCSYPGTSASAWVDYDSLKSDCDLKVYTDEYTDRIKNIDIEAYKEINYFSRKNADEVVEDYNYRNTLTPGELFLFQQSRRSEAEKKDTENLFGKYSLEQIMQKGFLDADRPAALYETMVRKIAGFTARGVIFYQGCNDADKYALYERLFTLLINVWRKDWGDELPFIITQLAPFGSWMGNSGEKFPYIRRAQQEICKNCKSVYLISTSDIGNKDDIHPKFKRKVGERLCLQALDKIYGKEIRADAPQFKNISINRDEVTITFKNADNLKADGGINALYTEADGEEFFPETKISKNRLILRDKKILSAEKITVKFACTDYYRVNLYNENELPAFPFYAEIQRTE